MAGQQPGDARATVDDLDTLATLCAGGILDACDLGLLLVAVCSEQEVPTDAVCVHLARRRALPAPEPTWRDVPLPDDVAGCFVLEPAPGPHAQTFAPGGVFCLTPRPAADAEAGDPAAATGPAPRGPAAPSVSVARLATRPMGKDPDAMDVRIVGERRVQRDGTGVNVLPLTRVDLVPLGAITSTEAGDLGIVLASLTRGRPLRVATAYVELAARRLDPAELERIAPGLDRLPLEATCEQARACLMRVYEAQVQEAVAEGSGWDGAPPEVPTTFAACQAALGLACPAP